VWLNKSSNVGKRSTIQINSISIMESLAVKYRKKQEEEVVVQ